MALGWTYAIALQTFPDLVQRPCARSGDNVFLDGLAAAVTAIAETTTLGVASYDREYLQPTAGRPRDRILPRPPPRVQDAKHILTDDVGSVQLCHFVYCLADTVGH